MPGLSPAGVGPGPVFIFSGQESQLPASVKAYKTYYEQVDLLASRGMDIDRDAAIKHLQHINYYRLSGYWYSFGRQGPSDREDSFTPELLSTMSLGFTGLMRPTNVPILKPALLGRRATQGASYATWMQRYQKGLADSKEDFVSTTMQSTPELYPVGQR
jgi:hypothetical protein